LGRIWAEYDVVLFAVETQGLDLPLWQVGAVGDPDRPVLEGVDCGLVAYWFFVETAILPDGVVLSSDRRTLGVVHVPLGVHARWAHVVGLDPARGAAPRFLAGVHDNQRGEAPKEDRGDQTHNDVGSPRTSPG
jgi:hypothetical protein